MSRLTALAMSCQWTSFPTSESSSRWLEDQAVTVLVLKPYPPFRFAASPLHLQVGLTYVGPLGLDHGRLYSRSRWVAMVIRSLFLYHRGHCTIYISSMLLD